MMILGREYMVFCYPYFVPTSITPVDARIRSLCPRITQSIEIAVLALPQIIGVFVKRHVSPRFAIIDSHLFKLCETHAIADLPAIVLLKDLFILCLDNALLYRDRLVCHGSASGRVSLW
ncbi:hypothetical protein [Burkholderia pseudomallei]|uniref:hypothetical protein n=1 Tax=Burkholderia pseudomallei TaxID=28450 RepID=UPI00201A33C7|nr:hypothetical protein [Burkholderia pseudomallei]MCL4670127.1 hypothetical protein [Burkholderia pseudomallei]